jgi:hypothetical protein
VNRFAPNRGATRACIAAVIALLAAVAPAQAKKVRYTAGPKPSIDTTYSVAQTGVEPIVRERGPRVPATNLQLVSLVANRAFAQAMTQFPKTGLTEVELAPAESHPLNFVAEHALVKELTARGVSVVVHRAGPGGDEGGGAEAGTDSAHSLPLADGVQRGGAVLEYQLASARVTYLRLRGWLPGRVGVERQALVEARLTLRDTESSRVQWTGEASSNLVDAFPRSQIPLVEDERFTDLKGVVPERSLGKLFEPVVVIGVVGGLIALFFQNRP